MFWQDWRETKNVWRNSLPDTFQRELREWANDANIFVDIREIRSFAAFALKILRTRKNCLVES